MKSAIAQLAQTRAKLPQYERQIAQDLIGPAYLPGEWPGSLDTELSTTAAVPPVPPGAPVGLPSTLARRCPDIRRAEDGLLAATAGSAYGFGGTVETIGQHAFSISRHDVE